MMKVQTQIDELITLRASEWFEVLKHPTEAERAAFVAWLGESRRHVQEFLEVAAVDEAVGNMPAELREDLVELIERVAPSAVELRARARPFAAEPERMERSRQWRTAGLIAACAAVAVVAIALLPTPAPSTRYATDVGEQRTIQLADSSVITLNADSRIQWHLDEARRDVELLHGEAIFKVAHDSHRPFRVRTRSGVVQAIGTQFNVYARESGETRVSVIEGRVQLTAMQADGGSTPQALIVKASEVADIRPDGTIHRNAKVSVDSAVAWRGRRLMFNDASLEEMVVEFNRYNRSPRLRLQDVPPGTYRFAGIFDSDDPQSLADLLSRESDLVVERHADEILIRKR